MKKKIYCPGFGDRANGMSVVAKLLLADPQGKDERIVHGAWLVGTWLACIRFGKYVRMPHGAYDPVRLAYHGWKKRLVGPIERFFLRRATKVLATSEAEARWIRAYEPRACVEMVDLKRFFKFQVSGFRFQDGRLHVLYLGRRHPLKGVEYLERAVEEMCGVELRIVSDHFGDELERDWEWCDVLVLPTLSENFGLVVAEALERGKRVITTDGAPAWEPEGSEEEKGKVKKCGRLTYLCGYREGTDAERVRLLKEALEKVSG